MFINLTYRFNISRYIINNTIQCKQDWQLDQHRQTSACRTCTVLVINCLCLSLHHTHRLFIFTVLILLLNLLKFGVHQRRHLRKLLLLDRQWNHQHIDNQRKQNNCQSYIINTENLKKSINVVHNETEDNSKRLQNAPGLCQN